MTTSPNGIIMIQTFEGLKLNAYEDVVGVDTIGYGSTYYQDGSKVKLGQSITKSEAEALLKHSLKQFEGNVLALLNGIKVNQNQFDALVSFAYNLGTGALAKSMLLKKIKVNHNDPTIAAEFTKWVMGGGVRLTGLVRRRKKEAELYFKPIV